MKPKDRSSACRFSSVLYVSKVSFTFSLTLFVILINKIEGLDPQFMLDLEVGINDKYSKLTGDADIVIFCGNVEIVVIEEKRGGTSSQDKTESGIPQALVEMDCLSKV